MLTNQNYTYFGNKFQFNPNKLFIQKRLFTFLGKQMNPYNQDFKRSKENFEDFEKSIRWCSYRQNIKNLKNSKNRFFSSDASKFIVIF